MKRNLDNYDFWMVRSNVKRIREEGADRDEVIAGLRAGGYDSVAYRVAVAVSPDWLSERVNDGYGTPPKHPFWSTVDFEVVGVWRIFERDGVWYGHKTTQNAWAHFSSRDEAVATAEGPQVDIWA